MQTSYSIKNTSIVNYPCTKLSSRRIYHLFKDGLMEFKYRKRNRITWRTSKILKPFMDWGLARRTIWTAKAYLIDIPDAIGSRCPWVLTCVKRMMCVFTAGVTRVNNFLKGRNIRGRICINIWKQGGPAKLRTSKCHCYAPYILNPKYDWFALMTLHKKFYLRKISVGLKLNR